SSVEQEEETRSVLRMVRREINDFQDERFEGLMTARNRLAAATVFGGAIAYGLLSLAIAVNISFDALWPLLLYYLIGIIGCVFNVVALIFQSDTAIPDYGLTRARMISSLTFSGLAGVAGILLISVLSEAIASSSTTTAIERAHATALQSIHIMYALSPH